MSGRTPMDPSSREAAVHHQMIMKEDQFTEIQNFTVFVGTWNVNDQNPPTDGSMFRWLAHTESAPDMYAVGFQELDLSKEAFVFNESPKEDLWKDAVTSSLHPNGDYVLVKLIRLVGIMMVIYVKREYLKYVKRIKSDTVGTGIMGKLGNKGGVSVSFEFHNTGICFVNSHLAALMNQTERRNQDYNDICDRAIFLGDDDNDDLNEDGVVSTFSSSSSSSQRKSIKDHDMVYWLGDLNYRINDADIDHASVKEHLLNGRDLEFLLERDQLRQQRILKKVFVGYNEGPITFLPTYKYDLGTDNWDSSEKLRTPSWTDRVLWKGSHIVQSSYSSHMELRVSDHKPVSSVFKAGIKVVDQIRYRKIYEEVMKKLDRLENEFLPQVSVDTTEIIFDVVKFNEPITNTLTVANTGQVPVQFEFIKKLNDTSYCKPWLSAKPFSGCIMPGDKIDIRIEVSVNKITASALNSGQDQMYDILVLHLINGKDIFITVSGTYRRSCFGASINALVQLTVPITEVTAGKIQELEKTSESAVMNSDWYPVPKELWFLCDLITTLGLDSEQLFLQPGLHSEMIVLRDWLDTGLPVDKPKVSIHSAAETLLMFLESLRSPVIPYEMYQICLDSSSNYLQCKQLVSQLPFFHKQVFMYMCAFLREVIRHSSQNGIDSKIMATLFASIFIREPPDLFKVNEIKANANRKLLDHKKTCFLSHFLENKNEI